MTSHYRSSPPDPGESALIAEFIKQRGVTLCPAGKGGEITDICVYCGLRLEVCDFPVLKTGNRSLTCRWCRASSWRRCYAKRHDQSARRIPAIEIFERDGWVCGICGDPIDKFIEFPHAMYMTTDHVVPLSRGGKHTRENLQAAHLHCNVRKSDRPQRRQRLLGNLLIG